MSKVLYVRGFNDKLHQELDDQARKDGVSPASILEEAYEEWLKKRQGTPTMHCLLLYSDNESLLNFLKKSKEMLNDDFVKLCAGPPSHSAIKFLKKNGWIDGTNPSYAQGIKKTPEQ